MTVRTYDGATGKSETTQYSKYYDAGDWIIEGKLGMSVVVDHEKKNIPVLHGLQRSIGALGPGELEDGASAPSLHLLDKILAQEVEDRSIQNT
jgi:hypothetical protein